MTNENNKLLSSQQKRCKQCGELKHLSEFTKSNFSYYAACKSCCNANKRTRYHTDSAFRQRQLEASRVAHAKMYATAEGRYKSHQRNSLRRSGGCLTSSEWLDILDRFDNECAYCGSTMNLTQDHIIPVSLGGKTVPNNIVPACASCNCSKRDRDVTEWYYSQSFFSTARYAHIMEVLHEYTK